MQAVDRKETGPPEVHGVSEEPTIHLGQWYHPVLNPPAFEHLASQVSDATDLQMRRTNHRVGNQFHDVSSKLEITRFHVKSIVDRMSFARGNLVTMLADLAADLETNPDQHRRVAASKQLIVEFRDHVLVAHLEGLLTQAKCLLDSLAQFYSIAFVRSVKTFSDKGKNVLKDMHNLGAKCSHVSSKMADLINAAKKSWIDEAIGYRDELVHFGQLRDFRCLHVPLTTATRYRPEVVLDSVMPSGLHTTTYVESLMRSSHTFSAKWLALMFAEMCSQKEN